MNVLCVIDHFVQGGAQRQLVNIACGLQRRGHRLEFFVYYPDAFFKRMVDDAGIAVHLCPKKRRLSLKPIRDLRRLIQDGGFDSVLAFLETPCVYAEIACLGLKMVRLVVSERSSVPDGIVTISKWVKAQLHRQAHVITTNSFVHTEWMANSFPWIKNRLTTIVNGVDLNQFRPRSISLPDDQLRLLGLGRITKQKNIPGLARAIELCRSQKGIDVRVDWVGRTDGGSVLIAAKESIEKARLGESWRWLGQRQDVAELMHQYDALILPSLWEGLPNAVCEALASGLPVLASRVSDNPRLVEEGVTGFLFDPRDPEDMAEAIAKFNDLAGEARLGMGIAGRAFAERELSMEKCTIAYESILMGASG